MTGRKIALALLLPALAACGQAGRGSAPSPQNSTGSPPPGPGPAQQGDGPANDTGVQSAPPERFIVCPGNPRCPPDGSQPSGR